MSSKKRPPTGAGAGYTKSSKGFDKTGFIKSNRAAARALTKEFAKKGAEEEKKRKLEALSSNVGPDDGTTSLYLEKIFGILRDHHLNNPSDPFLTSEDLVKRACLQPPEVYPKLKACLQDPNSRYRFKSTNDATSYAIKLRHYAQNADGLVDNMRASYEKHGYRGEKYKNNLQWCYKDVLKDLKILHKEKRLVVMELKDKHERVQDHLVFYADPLHRETALSEETKQVWKRAKSDGPQQRLDLLRKCKKSAIKTFRPIVKHLEPVDKKKKKGGRSNVALTNSHLKDFPDNF